MNKSTVDDLKKNLGHLQNHPLMPETNSRQTVDKQSVDIRTDKQIDTNADIHTKFDSSPVTGRPKAFYITEQQNELIDKAVKRLNIKLKNNNNAQVDRSALLRIIIDQFQLDSEDSIDRLAKAMVEKIKQALI